ncbi:MAG: hypothetical protein AB7H80_12955 [Candidatus Kapaibacterium sp.]
MVTSTVVKQILHALLQVFLKLLALLAALTLVVIFGDIAITESGLHDWDLLLPYLGWFVIILFIIIAWIIWIIVAAISAFRKEKNINGFFHAGFVALVVGLCIANSPWRGEDKEVEIQMPIPAAPENSNTQSDSLTETTP